MFQASFIQIFCGTGQNFRDLFVTLQPNSHTSGYAVVRSYGYAVVRSYGYTVG